MNTTNAYSNDAAIIAENDTVQPARGVRESWRLSWRLSWKEQALSAALACLGMAYALSWAEVALAQLMTHPEEPVAALVASHVLVGGLYVCVAFRLQWARWITVALGFASVVLVGPMLGAEWHVFPTAALVTGAVLVSKLAASIFLLSPNASHAAQ